MSESDSGFTVCSDPPTAPTSWLSNFSWSQGTDEGQTSTCEGYNALSIRWVPQSDFLQLLQLLQLPLQICVELL